MVVNKSKSAFKTIAEAAEELGVATHVLRFWETKFPQIQPMKRAGGHRYYRPDDIEVLKVIKEYLYEKRYTIEGVQKLFKGSKIKDIIGKTIQDDFFKESEEDRTKEVAEKASVSVVEVRGLSEADKDEIRHIISDLSEIKSSIMSSMAEE